MNKLTLLTILAILTMALPSSDAQVRGILKRTKDKVVYGANRMLVEKASDMLARAVLRRMESQIDEALRDHYRRQDSIAVANGEPRPYPDYESYLKSMNRAAEVPDSYSFDLRMYVTFSQEGEDDQPLVYYFSRDKGIFGLETPDAEEGHSFFVLDSDKGIMVMYGEEDGQKKAQALPNMMDVALAYSSAYKNEPTEEYEINPTGQSKKIAGYNAREYEVKEDKKESSLIYVTEELNFNWPDAFGKMMAQYIKDHGKEDFSKLKGIPLEGQELNKKGKVESSWTTTEVKTDTYVHDNKAYTFEDFSGNRDSQ